MKSLESYKLPESLERWVSEPGQMRCSKSACVNDHSVGEDIHYITIRHEVLKEVSKDMLCWWFRYFCYQTLVDSRGVSRSAFNLWHPRDHVSFSLQRHSLSGELGLARGAVVKTLEMYGETWPAERTAQVMHNGSNGFHMAYSTFRHVYGLQMEDYRETSGGVLVSTRLVLETRGLVSDASERHDRERIRAIKQALIRHKIEEIGNLERILPCISRLQRESWLGNSSKY